jgi:hypothetical protein
MSEARTPLKRVITAAVAMTKMNAAGIDAIAHLTMKMTIENGILMSVTTTSWGRKVDADGEVVGRAPPCGQPTPRRRESG